jgi:hypothetical protein
MNSSQRRIRQRVLASRNESHLDREVIREVTEPKEYEVPYTVLPFDAHDKILHDKEPLDTPMQKAVKKVNANINRMRETINKESSSG